MALCASSIFAMTHRKISKYIRTVFYDCDTVLLYNTVNKSIVALEKDLIDLNSRIVSLSDDDIISLEQMGFFISDSQALAEYGKIYNDDSQLIISIETHLKCNLSCPYCYQNGKKTSGVIDNNVLDSLYDYIVETASSRVVKTIVVKVLGGEPTIEWEKCTYILEKLYSFCKSTNIEFIVMVDTNGTLVNELCSFKCYDKMVLTIPLIEKTLHDKVRKKANQCGTYDLIVENINRIQNEMDRVFINIRYNVDNENKNHFETFVESIKEKIPKNSFIYLNYVMNLADCDYQNKMTLYEFNKWITSVAIPVLIKHRVPITIAPTGAKSKCQCFSKNSLKVFSDGTVGPCAMFFFKDRIQLSEYRNNHNLPNYWKTTKNLNILEKSCANCEKLFLCNGAKYMPCIKSVCNDPCNTLQGEIDFCLDDYIKLYYECMQYGCEDLFIGFDEQGLR